MMARGGRSVASAITTVATTLCALAESSSAIHTPAAFAAVPLSPNHLTPSKMPSTKRSSSSVSGPATKRRVASPSSASSSCSATPNKSVDHETNEADAPLSTETMIDLSKQPPRTSSFQPIWAGSLPSFGFEPISDEDGGGANDVKVHTLILGTHPSIASLGANHYFGHNMNAFWWIAGDCLGFRRASGVSSKGEPYKFTSHLRYGQDDIIPYDRQVHLLASRGFALWDVVESCERKGSLDADIKNERPNAIREFCADHPTVRRIVLANGGTGCAMFRKHFDGWWRSGELAPEPDHEASVKAFKKYAKVTDDFKVGRIRCLSAISVSPAAAVYSYVEKRAFWEEFVYRPGLEDHKELMPQEH